ACHLHRVASKEPCRRGHLRLHCFGNPIFRRTIAGGALFGTPHPQPRKRAQTAHSSRWAAAGLGDNAAWPGSVHVVPLFPDWRPFSVCACGAGRLESRFPKSLRHFVGRIVGGFVYPILRRCVYRNEPGAILGNNSASNPGRSCAFRLARSRSRGNQRSCSSAAILTGAISCLSNCSRRATRPQVGAYSGTGNGSGGGSILLATSVGDATMIRLPRYAEPLAWAAFYMACIIFAVTADSSPPQYRSVFIEHSAADWLLNASHDFVPGRPIPVSEPSPFFAKDWWRPEPDGRWGKG